MNWQKFAARLTLGMKTRPKRSILFLNVFGEELGLLGSRYYGRNPLVPLAKTVANLNLEQLGRTDGKDGSGAGKAQLTGFDFSTLPATIARAYPCSAPCCQRSHCTVPPSCALP